MADAYPPLTWRVFAMPKAGHGHDQYEDAFAGDLSGARFAIADGASESAFAKAWADLLVKGYTRHAGSWSGWLPEARNTWHQAFQDREFSWYTEEKFLEGAWATFLGVCFQSATLHWQAVAIGDCCLFQVRNHRLIESFPVRHANGFGNRPDLIGSRTASTKIRRLEREGDWLTDDKLLLMTDALAQWFLERAEGRGEPWKEVLSLATQEAFEAWIIMKRNIKELRNDDVTLMVIG